MAIKRTFATTRCYPPTSDQTLSGAVGIGSASPQNIGPLLRQERDRKAGQAALVGHRRFVSAQENLNGAADSSC